MLFAIQEAKKLPENDNLRKIHNQFKQRNSGEQHTGRQRSDSAEPDSGDLSQRSIFSHKPQATEKFFGAAIFQKCCRGVGEQPTFAKQIQFLEFVFPAAIASFETVKFAIL